MSIAVIIPARYGSTRFPGKPLALIGGQSMLSRVVDLAKKASTNIDNIQILVATEDQRIADHAAEIGVNCVLTSDTCRTGSDRSLEAARTLQNRPDFIVNLQGDAPFTPPEALEKIINTYRADPAVQVVTPVHKLSWDGLDALRNSKVNTPFTGTTVTIDKNGQALWFSKNIIPAIRKENDMREHGDLYSPIYQHMGLYGFTYTALEKFCALPESTYEKLEGLEQLRLLENDIPITCVEIESVRTLQSGIDSPEDIARAEALLSL